MEEIKRGKIYKPVYDKQTKSFQLVFDRDEFTLPPKLYGDVVEYSELIKINFHDYFKMTGCLFTGKQGSGKTLQAYHLCNYITEFGYDVMYICGERGTDELIKFINSTTFQGVIFIDEFGRLFDWSKIPLLLTTFSDATYHRLLIITENNTNRLPVDITERPGRFLFKREYSRVTDRMIQECCDDKGASQAFADELMYRNKYCPMFTLDILINVVETHVKFPTLTLDEMTEKFSFDGLRLNLRFGKVEIWYDGICITGNDESNGKQYISASVVNNFHKLDLTILREFLNKERELTLSIHGSFTLEDFEKANELVETESAPVEESGEEKIEPMPEQMNNMFSPMMNNGNMNNGFNKPNVKNPPFYGLKLPKPEQEAFNKVSGKMGYVVNYGDCIELDENECCLLIRMTPKLHIKIPYETSAMNSYGYGDKMF